MFEEAREEVVKNKEAGVKMFEVDRVLFLAIDWLACCPGYIQVPKTEQIKLVSG